MAFSLLIGLSTVLGWHTRDLDWIVSWVGVGWTAYNTGLCLILSAIAIYGAQSGRRLLSLLVATPLGILSGLTLLRYAIGATPFEVDGWFWATDPTGVMTPNEMALSSSLCFFVTFVVVTLASFGPVLVRVVCYSFLGIFLVAVSASTLLGQLIHFSEVISWWGSASMTFQAALGLMAQGAVLFLVAWGDSEPVKVWRKRVSAPLVFGMLLMTVIFWRGLEARSNHRIQQTVNARGEQLRVRLVEAVTDQLAPLRRMASEWKLNGRPDTVQWKFETESILRHFDSYQTLIWADDSLQPKRVVANSGVWSEQGPRLALGEERIKTLKEMRGIPTSRLFWTKDLVHTGKTFQFYFPVMSGELFDGFLISINEVEQVIKRALDQEGVKSLLGFRLESLDEVLYSEAREKGVTRYQSKRRLDLYGLSLSLTFWPYAEMVDGLKSWLPEVFLCLGTLISLLIGYLLSLSLTVHEKMKDFQSVNRFLEASDEQLRRQSLELMQAKVDAEVASQHKSQFLANVSHELRTPLNAILGLSELFQETRMTKKQKDYSKGIRSASEALLSLISEVLDFSKIETGSIELREENFSPGELMEDITSFLSPLASNRGLEFRCEIDESLPRLVRGDRDRLRQALVNICGNALKFTEAGMVEFRLLKKNQSKTEVNLCFEVEDTGIGISNEQLDKIFQPFYQVDGSNTRDFEGTGLGLAISLKLIQKMKGEIEVDSELGVGSLFRFQLKFPIAESETKEVLADLVQFEGSLLLVEDNRVNQQVISRMVEKFGFTVDIASNGQEALEAVQLKSYQFVLMDCQMPVLDGYRAAEGIREWEQETGRNRLPIIALTAFANTENRKKCVDSGMDDYLTKPLTLASLNQAFGAWKHYYSRGSGMAAGNLADPGTLTQEQSSSSVLDKSVLFSLRLLEGEDPKFFPNLVKTFLVEGEKKLNRLKKLSRTKKFKTISDVAHGFRSEAAQMGAMSVSELCAEIEALGNAKKSRGLVTRVNALEKAFVDAQVELAAEAKIDGYGEVA